MNWRLVFECSSPRLAVVLLMFQAVTAFAEPNNPNTDWFAKAGFGVFVHYLWDLQNASNRLHSLGRQTSWAECVREFDTERFAESMREAGAGYVIFTMNQRTRFLIAPNAAFDRISGYAPGEACTTRDLVLDLHAALAKRQIPLMLYTTGDGPCHDLKAAAAFRWSQPVTTNFVSRWAEVIREYAERYGDKVAGWWVDGCYRVHGNYGYDDEKLGILAGALKAGNPRRIIALNNGVDPRVLPYTRHNDFNCGEQELFFDRPASRWLNGEQWHILSFLGHPFLGNPLGTGWSQPGVRYSREDFGEYIAEVNRAGGVVSIDVMLYRDGSLDRSQLETLKGLRAEIAKHADRPTVPPGNLAFRKPARLLSLDGSHPIEVNGGGGRPRFAKLGVDGRPETYAMGGGEWPWTYEIDLLEVRPVSRVRVTFAADHFATRLRVQLSPDGQRWQTVAEADGLEGQPFAAEFKPLRAQFVRVSALKPDGPNQPGAQMGIAELEVYEP
jgi:hypothetical protein